MRTRTRTSFCSRERPLWLPQSEFCHKFARRFAINQSASTSLALFLHIETCASDCSKKGEALALVYLDCEVWSKMYNNIDKTEAMTFNIEKNHGLYHKAGKEYSSRVFCIQNTELRSSLCLIIPAQWIQMTKFYINKLPSLIFGCIPLQMKKG